MDWCTRQLYVRTLGTDTSNTCVNFEKFLVRTFVYVIYFGVLLLNIISRCERLLDL